MSKCLRIIFSALLIGYFSLSQAQQLLYDTEGQSTPLSSLKGKWVFINYWAGWCHSCLAEIPEFNSFYQSIQKDKVALFGVNFDALSLNDHKRLIKKLDIRYPNLIKDPAPDLGIDEIIGLPVTFVFNPKGTLVETLYGGQTQQSLNQVIKARD